jgi:hypothetical protein
MTSTRLAGPRGAVVGSDEKSRLDRRPGGRMRTVVDRTIGRAIIHGPNGGVVAIGRAAQVRERPSLKPHCRRCKTRALSTRSGGDRRRRALETKREPHRVDAVN